MSMFCTRRMHIRFDALFACILDSCVVLNITHPDSSCLRVPGECRWLVLKTLLWANLEKTKIEHNRTTNMIGPIFFGTS